MACVLLTGCKPDRAAALRHNLVYSSQLIQPTPVYSPSGLKRPCSAIFLDFIPMVNEGEEDGSRAELTVFHAKESYVYQIPPAQTAGHRAETWNVDNWLQVNWAGPCCSTRPGTLLLGLLFFAASGVFGLT